jgi:hypothetical protein
MAYQTSHVFVSPDKVPLDQYLKLLREGITNYMCDVGRGDNDGDHAEGKAAITAFELALNRFKDGPDYRLEIFPRLLEFYWENLCGGPTRENIFPDILCEIGQSNFRVQALYDSKYGRARPLLPERRW